MRRPTLACALFALVGGPAAAPAVAAGEPPSPAVAGRGAMLVLVPGPSDTGEGRGGRDRLLRALESRRGLAIGLMSPTQGTYTPSQMMLDITQGIRASPVSFDPRRGGRLVLEVRGATGTIRGWEAAVRRAATAPGQITPGRLASAIPGGAAFVGIAGEPNLGAVAAADARGRVATVALGSLASAPARARALSRRHRFVVVQLAGPEPAALGALDRLVATRRRGQLVLVAQSPPDIDRVRLLPIAQAIEGPGPKGLSSDTTRTRGLVAGIDLLPAILGHLGRAVDGSVTGRPIRLDDPRGAAALERLRTRYAHVAPRRIRTLTALVGVWVVLLAGLGAVGRGAGLRRGLRIGGLAFLWVPAAVLVPALFDPPTMTGEVLLVTGGAYAAALLSDRLLRWPRAPLAPAAVCLGAFAVALVAGSNLVESSLLGPNPRSGTRFFGIGNELESALPTLLFLGVAAGFAGAPRSRAMAWTFAGLGAAAAVLIGSGHLGADVGGVITVSAGTAVAVLAALPGRLRRRGIVAALCAPPLALAGLVALDLLTGANTHFSRNVIAAPGGASLWEVALRRYDLAWHSLARGFMPLIAGVAGLAVLVAWLRRERLRALLPGPAYTAALLGGLTAGVVGALSNDSGPLLFVVAVWVLGVAVAYLAGGPAPARATVAAPRGKGSPFPPAGRPPMALPQSAFPDPPDPGRPSATAS